MSSHSPAQPWNPRYLAYCRAQGNSPEAQDVNDTERFPGGKMCGYILWINQQLVAGRAERPEFFAGHTLLDHDGFDRWLNSKFGEAGVLELDSQGRAHGNPEARNLASPIHLLACTDSTSHLTDTHLASCQRCRREVGLANAE